MIEQFATGARPPLVGRLRESDALWTRFEAAATGQTGVVLIAGEPGIGKTRLLDAFAARATSSGARVLRGGASEAAGMPPYLPFLEALGQHVRATPPDELRSSGRRHGGDSRQHSPRAGGASGRHATQLSAPAGAGATAAL